MTPAALLALQPRRSVPPCPIEVAQDVLEAHLQLVAAHCERAIVAGWQSGRIGYPAGTGRPFESEVAALLRRGAGGDSEELQRVEARLQAQRRRCAELLAAAPGHPLVILVEDFGLAMLDVEILLVVAAPRLWGELARLYAIVANDPDRPLCDELLVCQLLEVEGRQRHDIARALEGDRLLLRRGLLLVDAGQRPFAGLHVDPLIVRRLRGEPFCQTEPGDLATLRAADRTLAEMMLPGELVQGVVQALSCEQPGYARLVLRGRLGSGRRTLCAALAAQTDRPLGVIDLSLFADAARLPEHARSELMRVALRGWLPCLTGFEDLAIEDPGRRNQLREVLRLHPGPLMLRCNAGTEPPLDPGFLLFDLPPLTEGQRAECWARVLGRRLLPVTPAEGLAARHYFGPGIIERVAEQAAARTAPEASDEEVVVSLDDAIRQHRDTRLQRIASRVTRLPTWSSVVLPPEVLDSLYELIGRVDHRRTVYEAWGFDWIMTSSRGITALFQGLPGTGKSMVAGVIARELGFDLYRVDLSRVLSKWIGETERNLAALFDAAEEGQTIILFDEADALFARRTEVKSSVDRYANAEVNYLLQRLDSFEGIAILTTNFGTSIDAAFKRRMSFRLSFPFPDEEMREQLWQAHLPPELPIVGALDLAGLAARFQISGGYIRNAVLRGAFLAAQEGVPLTQDHLERAVRLEYREMGKLIDQGVLE